MLGLKSKAELIMYRSKKYSGKRDKHEQRSWGREGARREEDSERSVVRAERAREVVGKKR